MCVSYTRAREILLEAEDLGKMVYNGEYLFFNVELTNTYVILTLTLDYLPLISYLPRAQNPNKPWIYEQDSVENQTRLAAAYKSVITLTSYSASNVTNVRSKFIDDFYNSLLVYATTLSTFLTESFKQEDNLETRVNGYELVGRVFNNKYTGK